MADERLNSIFLERTGLPLQTFIDRANDRFAPLWYPRFFSLGRPTVSLDFTTVIGRSAVQTLASVISEQSEIPLRARQGLEKLQGEVPTIAHGRKMTAKEYREMQVLTAMGASDGVQMDAIFDLLYNDITFAGNGVHKRMDAMCLQAVSTGRITVNVDNNPDGIGFDVDLLLNTDQRLNPVKAWTDETADIIGDIEKAELFFQDKGRAVSRILVSRTLWNRIAKNKSIQDYVKAYNNPGSNARYAVTRDSINEALGANLLPNFEIIDERSSVERDGKASPFRFWNDDSAVFAPNGLLGVIHNALSDEQIMGSPDVYQYGYYRNAQIMRWHQRKPLTEYTVGEWKAFPGVEAIDSLFIMDTETPAV